jgi:hypothetical protein
VFGFLVGAIYGEPGSHLKEGTLRVIVQRPVAPKVYTLGPDWVVSQKNWVYKKIGGENSKGQIQKKFKCKVGS